jgi:saccharopine dehydrogenase-like NADP-dependent oxidoreductase
MISPVELSSELLFPIWKLRENEKEFTVLKLRITGEGGEVIEYSLFDSYDVKTQTTSMARTTGYTCASVANLVLNGDYKEKGISPPEYVGRDQFCFNYVLDYLAGRSVNIRNI